MPGSLAPMHVLNDRYEITEWLGDNALLAAYRAHDRVQNSVVVVKTLLPQYDDHAEIVSALRAGVDDALTLAHPRIARALDVGADAKNGVLFFFVEEYGGGMDLRERIRRNAPLSQTVAVDTAIVLADVLQFAAEHGLCHGDVRPAHVLTGAQSPLKLSGWGVAEARSLAAGENPQLLQASAPYTAPEIWTTGMPSASGDLYALGIMLYEMLTGRFPFAPGGNMLAVARQHAAEPVPSPKDAVPTLPRAIDGVTQKLLAKRPVDRYQTPSDLLADLRVVRDDLRFGRSLAWSPLDAGTRPALEGRDTSSEGRESETVVMPVGAPKTGKTVALVPNAKVTVPVETVAPPAAALPIEETQTMAAALPARKRNGHSFSWLLPLNLFLATVFVATCGYVVNLTLVALESPDDVIVPNLVGKSLTEAKTLGVQKKFVVEVINEQFSDKYAEGIVYVMRPEPGRHIRENKKVTVTVSKGPRMVTVPDVYDVSFDKARRLLEKVGLRVGDTKKEWDVITAKGNVLQQVPSEGENRPRGTKVDLVLSKGPEPVEETTDPPVITADPVIDTPTTLPDNDEESSLTLNYTVPSDGRDHTIRIDVRDSRGTRTLISEEHKAGENVALDVTGYGKQILFRVYDNDSLQDKITGPPWPGGDKKP